LSFRRSGNLGLVMARSHDTLGSDPFFPAFIAGVESAVAPSGIFLLVRLVADEQAESEAYRELARTGRVDGVFVTDLRVDDPRPPLLDKLGLPAVTLNRPAGSTTATAVCVDDGPAVREAVRHLIELGHRSIGHIGGPSTYLHAAHRRRVWADALHESGLPEGPLVEADFSAGGGATATLEMLGAPNPPTAILYASDLMAVAGIAAARQCGALVPDHLSVVGFDDSQISAYLPAPLTTVHTDVYGWGKAAATALLARSEGQPVADIFLPAAQFVTRASTGPVPGGPRRQQTRRSAKG
jgi:DNA-binding LacI/PurR family transcriptional regulator